LGAVQLLTFFAALLFLYPRVCQPFSVSALSYHGKPKTLNLNLRNRHRRNYEVKPKVTLRIDENLERVLEHEEPVKVLPHQTKDIKFETELSEKELLHTAEVSLEHTMDSQNFSREMKRYLPVSFDKTIVYENDETTKTKVSDLRKKDKRISKKLIRKKANIGIDKKYRREKEFLSVTLFVRNKSEKTDDVEIRDFLPDDATEVDILSGMRKQTHDNAIAWHFNEMGKNELRILHYKFKSNESKLPDAKVSS